MAKKQKEAQEKKDKINENLDKFSQKRVQKFKAKAFEKMELIESFRQTLQEMEWKSFESEQQKAAKKLLHEEFLQTLEEDKVYKQLLQAAQK